LRTCLESLATAPGTLQDYLWVGWPGCEVTETLAERLRSTAAEKFHASPVFLSREDMERFYLGFCNKTLWPLFHYFTTYATFEEDQWECYRHINEVFCDAVMKILRDGDVLWIHDYHLMLLPALLRARAPGLTIGFFLHIPFPSYEVFRLLPGAWRKEILEGLLGADVIGFHTYGYMQNFLQAVLRILGYENHLGQISTPDRVVKAESFPMGIDFERFSGALDDREVQEEREALRKSLLEMRTVLSVDRLDYTKGVLNRLYGFERLLDQNPGLHGKVVLLMIVVPSRIGVDQYEWMKRQIEELVGKINGRFGGISWTPIIYQYRSLSFAPLAALYAVSDVALVTPLRDGMNLVAKEYVASRRERSGVLIISEMAGAAKELGEAIVINPHNTQEIAQALQLALDMPPAEQQRRIEIMQHRLRRYDVVRWGSDFIAELHATKGIQERFSARLLPAIAREALVDAFRTAGRRLILLDYDGTLVPFTSRPERATPGRDLLQLLRSLSETPGTSVVIISGRDRHTLQKWFGDIRAHLVAEHGAWIKEVNRDWTAPMPRTAEWKSRIIPILESYADRLPGAFVEEKEYSVVWHFRGAHPEQGAQLAGELTDHLVTFTANIDIQVLQGNKVVEVRNAGINKGVAGRHWLLRDHPDFVLAVGDDWTDEDLFVALPASAYTIKVGLESSHARFNVRDPHEVLAMLGRLTSTNGTPSGGEKGRASNVRMRDMKTTVHGRGETALMVCSIGLMILPYAAKLIGKADPFSWFRNPKR
jgi:trehalose 6-phosphate synthase/phosphatase